MRVALFIPCFVDALFPQAGIAMADVLERAGCDVFVPEGTTCCGQPAFNAGFWEDARKAAARTVDLLDGAEAIVSASSSCGAMLKVFSGELFRDSPLRDRVRTIAERTWEFSQFLVQRLGVTDVGARFPRRVVFHDGCHGLRELGVRSEPRLLLGRVRDLELVEMPDAASPSCCGFGGLFAVKFPAISSAMGELKCRAAAESGAEVVVSTDSSCLMQIAGLARRAGHSFRTMHLAEVLAST